MHINIAQDWFAVYLNNQNDTPIPPGSFVRITQDDFTRVVESNMTDPDTRVTEN